MMHANTIKTWLTVAKQQLTKSATPQLDAEILLAHVLGLRRSMLLARLDTELDPVTTKTFKTLLARRIEGEPIAYLVQEKEFWSLPLRVTPDTLIPRPETEYLVEAVLQYLPKDKPQTIVDLGTGTGAIAFALAQERPHWHILATDISASALQIAKINAKRLGIAHIDFRIGHWLEVIEKPVDAIVSNPPYLAADDPHLEGDGISFEPTLALVAANQGFASLIEIIQTAPKYLKPGGYLCLECGIGQADCLKTKCLQMHYTTINMIRDGAGIERVLVATV